MAAFFHKALDKLTAANLTGDVRAALLMTNTSVAGDIGAAATLDDIGTLDEYDGSGYARVALTNKSFTFSDPLDGYVWTSDPITWANLGAGTRSAAGVLLYLHVTNDTDSIPILWLDTGGFPINGNGLDFVVNPDATNGWGRVRNA
jgi:hypothetical protein